MNKQNKKESISDAPAISNDYWLTRAGKLILVFCLFNTSSTGTRHSYRNPTSGGVWPPFLAVFLSFRLIFDVITWS